MTTMTKAEREAGRELTARWLPHTRWEGQTFSAEQRLAITLTNALDALDAADEPVGDAEVARWITILRARGADSYDTWRAADLIERLHRQLAAKERETAEKIAQMMDEWADGVDFDGESPGNKIRRTFNLDKEPGNG